MTQAEKDILKLINDFHGGHSPYTIFSDWVTMLGLSISNTCAYTELVCDAMPPKNGYAITKEGFQTGHWKVAYKEWCDGMVEWANKGIEEVDNDQT